MNSKAVMLAAVALCITSGAAAQESAQYDAVLFQENLMMPARDGVKLATDIYRPAQAGKPVEGKFPVLLHRTPYNKTGLKKQAETFARHGYVVVVQDTRGRYKSEGKWSKYFKYDATDGFDAMQYLAKLPYANGKIGTWGTSYGAHTQADAAKLNPPALATSVLNMGGMSSAWDHSVRYNGAFELGRQLTWAWGQIQGETDDPVVTELIKRENVVEWYDLLPLRKGLNPLSVVPNFEQYILDQATRADYDDYWKGIGMQWEGYYDQTADVPMMHVGGWYDVYTETTVTNFLELGKRKKSPQRMVIGPWTHGGNDERFAGDVDFGPEAAIADFGSGFHVRWFDHFLKGKKNGVEKEAAVRLFVMGGGDAHKTPEGRLFAGGYWRDETAWPVPGTRFVEYYFHADGSLTPQRPAAAEPASTTYTFDPRNPVPTIGGGVSGRLLDGAFDQREGKRFFPSKEPYLPLKARQDVVVFQTEPLTEDVEVVGPIIVKLYAASSATDTDFTAKLVDVYPLGRDFPTGFDMNLTDAIIRARYRASREKAQLLEPGKVYEYTIDLFPTANVFKQGHRIRVDISSSNFPRFDVNPNTGEPLGKNRRMTSADNTLFHSAAQASHIVLPLVASKRR